MRAYGVGLTPSATPMSDSRGCFAACPTSWCEHHQRLAFSETWRPAAFPRLRHARRSPSANRPSPRVRVDLATQPYRGFADDHREAARPPPRDEKRAGGRLRDPGVTPPRRDTTSA